MTTVYMPGTVLGARNVTSMTDVLIVIVLSSK